MTDTDAYERWTRARAAVSVPDGFADRVADAAARRRPGRAGAWIVLAASGVFALRALSMLLVFASF